MKHSVLFFFLLIFYCDVQAQELAPGFDATEYADVLALNFGRYDSMQRAAGAPNVYQKIYTSRVTGLDNRWHAWLRSDGKVAVIGIRGTIATKNSWMANLYSVMQPAQGTIALNDSSRLTYRLALSPDAAVHTGWLIAMASMSNDIEHKIRELYDKGVHSFIISGHSQGGAIAYLLRAHLYYRTVEGALPAGITYKTYCSAAPKPGNLQFAYDYEFMNRGGWSFTVVNAADWVPEMPVSLQQLSDLNPLNPLTDVSASLHGQKWFVRLYAGLVYGKLTRKSRKAVKKYSHFLGDRLGKEVRKSLPQLVLPGTTATMAYARAGAAVVLMPDSSYFRQFPNDPTQGLGVWTHHSFEAYLSLLRKNYLPK